MEKEKFYYIKCYMYSLGNFNPYIYFLDLEWIEYVLLFPDRDIATISDIKYAKRYKSKVWAEKMIQKIYDETKDNVFLFDDEGNYKYKFEIVKE